jgi:galacturonokinase
MPWVYSVDEVQQPRPIRKKGESNATDSPKLQEAGNWGNFARGAVYALQSRGVSLTQV